MYNNLSSKVSSELSTIDVMYLPGEVLQNIFMNLDGHSLTVCKKVCKTWKDHAEYLTQRPRYWENRCFDEIPQYALLDLLDNMFPTHSRGEDKISVDWFEVYKSWFSWSVFYRSENASVVKTASGLNGITQIKVSGKLLLASSCCPVRLVAYTLPDDNWSEEELYVGGNKILDFELVNSDLAIAPNLPPSEERGKLFSLMDHNEIWIETKADYFQLGKDYKYSENKRRKSIAHSRGYKMTLFKQGFRIGIVETSLILEKISKNVSGPDKLEFRLRMENPYTEIMQFWGNRVCLGRRISDCCQCFECKRLQIKTVVIDMEQQKLHDVELATFSVGVDFPQLVCWQAAVFFGYSSERKFNSFFSGQWRFLQTPSKEGCISCCHVYNEYLFLGTDKGLLLVYFLEKPVEEVSHPAVLNIIPFETAAKQIKLPHCHIQAISVAESVNHGSRFPKVICASVTGIYVVSMEH